MHWGMETRNICLVVGVAYKGTRRLKRGGETTEVFLPHRGVRAHDTAMAQDSGVGACAAFTDGDGVSEWWATESWRCQLSESYAKQGRRWVLEEQAHAAPV